MNLSTQIAKHFRDIFFGGNWTSVNVKDSLLDLDWHQATTPVGSLNTISKLVYHINYYVSAVIKVLEGGPLEAHDKYSFDVPDINSQEDWDNLVNKAITEAEKFASLLEQLPESKWSENLAEEKYGNYYRNIHGIVEHTHYHLGQIVLIKKILLNPYSN